MAGWVLRVFLLVAASLTPLASGPTAAAQDPRYPDPAGYCQPGSSQYDPRDTARAAPPTRLPDGFTRRFAHLGGFRTVITEAGPREWSEAIVFLHGNPGSSFDWARVLAATPPGARVIALDLVGFGKADKPWNFDYSLDSAAAVFGRAMRELGVERVHLVGHDVGGVVGIEWASLNPGALASATLMATGALVGYQHHDVARIWRTPVEGEAFQAATTREFFVGSIQSSSPRPLPREFLDRNYDDYDRPTRCAILKSYRSVDDVDPVARRQVDRLRPHDRPALVIWGDLDPFLPNRLAHAQRMAFPRAEVHVFENTGHWPFVDEEGRTMGLMRPFFLRHVLARAGSPIRLAIRPRRARAGRRTRFRVRAYLGRGQPVSGALVRLGRARARTNARGRATFRARLRRRGRRRVTAARAPLRTGRASVQVLRGKRRR